jgi:2,5-dihydroxypyridine 5,6-dioxygenase
MHEALNHAKLAMLFRKEFELCNARKGETVVLLSDLGAPRDYVAAAFAAAEDFGADAYEMCVNAMPSWTKVGVETVGRCKGTLEAIKAADCTFRCSRAGSRRRARPAPACSWSSMAPMSSRR